MPQEMIPDARGGWYAGDAASPATLNKPFWAQIIATDGTYYSWEEVRPRGATMEAAPGGRFGTVDLNPAYEPNGVLLKEGEYVLLRRAYFDGGRDWVYITVCCGTTDTSPQDQVTNVCPIFEDDGLPDLSGNQLATYAFMGPTAGNPPAPATFRPIEPRDLGTATNVVFTGTVG